MVDLRGLPVARRVLTVLGRLGAVGLGLESIQRCFGTLHSGRLAAGGSAVSGVDQLRTIRCTLVPVTPRPITVDGGTSTVVGGVLDGHDAGLPVPLVRGDVTGSGYGIPAICGQVPDLGTVQDAVDLGVPTRAVTIPIVRHKVALVGEPVPTIGCRVPLVRQLIPPVRGAQSFLPPPLRLREAFPSSVHGVRQIIHVAHPHHRSGDDPTARPLPS